MIFKSIFKRKGIVFQTNGMLFYVYEKGYKYLIPLQAYQKHPRAE